MSEYQLLFDRLMGEVDKVNQLTTVSAADAPEVSGTAYDERITVRMRAGKVTAIEIQPLAMRLTNAELSEHVTTAVNEAIDANVLTVMTGAHGIDLHGLNAELREIQAESVVLMGRYTDHMMGMLTRARDL